MTYRSQQTQFVCAEAQAPTFYFLTMVQSYPNGLRCPILWYSISMCIVSVDQGLGSRWHNPCQLTSLCHCAGKVLLFDAKVWTPPFTSVLGGSKLASIAKDLLYQGAPLHKSIVILTKCRHLYLMPYALLGMVAHDCRPLQYQYGHYICIHLCMKFIMGD